LNDPFPIESNLVGQLTEHLNAEIAAGTILNKQNCLDFMTWTFYFRRIVKNPAFYGVKDTKHKGINDHLVKLIDEHLEILVKNECIEIGEDDFTIESTFIGRKASFYYLKPASVYLFNQHLEPNLSIYELL